MVTPTLFDDFPRVDASPANAAESEFEFLNRSAAEPFRRTRQELERWFAALPTEARTDVRSRIRSASPAAHAAFWELYLHHLFTCLGYSVELHPSVPTRTTRPDFLFSNGLQRLFVEARVVLSSHQDLGGIRRQERVYDGLGLVESPNFWLDVDLEVEGTREFSVARHRCRLERWLGSLDPELAEEALRDGDEALPTISIEDEGWRVVVTAYPKAPEDRGSGEARPVGSVGPGQGIEFDDTAPVRKALRDKGSKYGDLGAPYLLALLVLRDFLEDYDIDCALYGTWGIAYTQRLRASDRSTTRRGRLSNGYFQTGHGYRHTGVSGLLVAKRLRPWHVATVTPELWRHPAAARPLPDELPFVSVDIDVATGRIGKRRPTTPIHEILGLRRTWPEFPSRLN